MVPNNSGIPVRSKLFLTLLMFMFIGCSILALGSAQAYNVTMRDFLIIKNDAEHFHDPFDSGGPPPDSPGLTPNPAIVIGYGVLGNITEDHTGGGSINMNSGNADRGISGFSGGVKSPRIHRLKRYEGAS